MGAAIRFAIIGCNVGCIGAASAIGCSVAAINESPGDLPIHITFDVPPIAVIGVLPQDIIGFAGGQGGEEGVAVQGIIGDLDGTGGFLLNIAEFQLVNVRFEAADVFWRNV